MILAAGRGTRLGELGRTVPKALVEVGGRPLLAHQLDFLASAGVEHIVINAHHLAGAIVEFVAGARTDADVQVSVEPELLGTAGGVRAALGRFRAGEPIIVLYADTLLRAPLREIVHTHRARRADATVCAGWLQDTTGKGVLELDATGVITAFVEKPAHPRPGLACAGLYVIEAGLLSDLAPGHFADFGHDVFPQAIAAGRSLRAHRLDGAAHDIGTPEALAAIQDTYAAEVLR